MARELESMPTVSGDLSLGKALDDLGVSSFLVKTIPGRMLFDRTRLRVRCGQKFTIFFKNNDLMPHNLLIVEPGETREMGSAADLMAASPYGLAKGCIPDSGRAKNPSSCCNRGRAASWLSPCLLMSKGNIPLSASFPVPGAASAE